MNHQKRYIRYLILLTILLVFAVNELRVYLKVNSWSEPLTVQIITINGDGAETTGRYIRSLVQHDIVKISSFLSHEASKYSISEKPVKILQLKKGLSSRPPDLPGEMNVFSNIYWSIRFRVWSAWTLYQANVPHADITLFVKYFDPLKHQTLQHSIGLQKGMVGIINAFASKEYNGSNNVIIAHELLHTVGATDKYHFENNFPFYPAGFSDPHRKPLYPQTRAEIMGGRIPLSSFETAIPTSLDEVVVGDLTALEIGWKPL